MGHSLCLAQALVDFEAEEMSGHDRAPSTTVSIAHVLL
jgi:hypothetical protein